VKRQALRPDVVAVPLNLSRGEKSAIDGPLNLTRGEKSAIVAPSNLARGEKSAIAGPSNLTRGEKSAIVAPSNLSRGEKSAIVGPSNLTRGEKSAIVAPLNLSRGEKSAIAGPLNLTRGEKSAIAGPSNLSRGEKSGIAGSSIGTRGVRRGCVDAVRFRLASRQAQVWPGFGRCRGFDGHAPRAKGRGRRREGRACVSFGAGVTGTWSASDLQRAGAAGRGPVSEIGGARSAAVAATRPGAPGTGPALWCNVRSGAVRHPNARPSVLSSRSDVCDPSVQRWLSCSCCCRLS
jgi:hypothetical protein